MLAGFLVLGAWCLQTAESAAPLPSLARFVTGEPVMITAHVIREGIAQGEAPRQRVTADVETEEIVDQGAVFRSAAGIRLSLDPHLTGSDEEEDAE